MIYLDGEDILRLHKVVIDFSGGSHGVRDAHLLASILEAPRQSIGGKELYPDVWHKAAIYFENLANFHVFVDGNKRTALAGTVRFLVMNGYRLTASNTAVEKFVLAVVLKKFDIPTIARWLRKNCERG